MKKNDWLLSLRSSGVVGSFTLSDRSSRARRALLFASTLLIALHTFDIEIKGIPAVGVDFSSEPQTVEVVLMLAVLFFLVSFVFLSWGDFNDRPISTFRQKVWGTWSHNFQSLQSSYRTEFLDVLRPHLRQFSDAEFAVTEDRDPIFRQGYYAILDESPNERIDQLLQKIENKLGPILTDLEKIELQTIVKNWWSKCRSEYRWTLFRYYYLGGVYFIGVYALEVIFPVFWALVSLLIPDLSWVQNLRTG